MNIRDNIETIRQITQKYSAKLITVSKTYPPEVISEAYQVGMRSFGENRVQELIPKYEALPKDIEWHLIGTLQSNKVKYIAPFVSLIHSIDSAKLSEAVNKEAQKHNRIIDCLLQIHIATEETKQGFSYTEAAEYLQSGKIGDLTHIRIIGMMGMATFTENQSQIRAEFKSLKAFFEKMKSSINLPNVALSEISMGMSGDYVIALQEGSTMIRVGSAVFGKR
jgi:hypothetical protein